MITTHQNDSIYIMGTVGELMAYAKQRIRKQSREFYDRAILEDLYEDGFTLIDRHAIGSITLMFLEGADIDTGKLSANSWKVLQKMFSECSTGGSS